MTRFSWDFYDQQSLKNNVFCSVNEMSDESDPGGLVSRGLDSKSSVLREKKPNNNFKLPQKLKLNRPLKLWLSLNTHFLSCWPMRCSCTVLWCTVVSWWCISRRIKGAFRAKMKRCRGRQRRGNAGPHQCGIQKYMNQKKLRALLHINVHIREHDRPESLVSRRRA